MMFIDGVRALFAFAAVLPLVDACLCSGDGDLCSQYDQASVVIHVKVLSSISTTIEGQANGDTVSGFKTLGAYKGQLNHITAQPGETFDIATWGDSAPCGVNLVPGKEYLIGLYDTSANANSNANANANAIAHGDGDGDGGDGGGDGGGHLQSMDLCGMFREWETVTKDEWITMKSGCRDNGGGGVVAPRRLGNAKPPRDPSLPKFPKGPPGPPGPGRPVTPPDDRPTRALGAPGGRGSKGGHHGSNGGPHDHQGGPLGGRGGPKGGNGPRPGPKGGGGLRSLKRLRGNPLEGKKGSDGDRLHPGDHVPHPHRHPEGGGHESNCHPSCDDDHAKVCTPVNDGQGYGCVYVSSKDCLALCGEIEDECVKISVSDGAHAPEWRYVCVDKCLPECPDGECAPPAFACDSENGCSLSARGCALV